MHDRYSTDRTDATERTDAPSECPVCRSSDVKTTSKAVTAESYWRCVACGEVWNVGRREPTRYRGSSWYRG